MSRRRRRARVKKRYHQWSGGGTPMSDRRSFPIWRTCRACGFRGLQHGPGRRVVDTSYGGPPEACPGKRTALNECERLASLETERDAISEFLYWLSEQGIMLVKNVDYETEEPTVDSIMLDEDDPRYETTTVKRSQLVPITEGDEALILRHLGIDTKKLEQERRALLDQVREAGASG